MEKRSRHALTFDDLSLLWDSPEAYAKANDDTATLALMAEDDQHRQLRVSTACKTQITFLVINVFVLVFHVVGLYGAVARKAAGSLANIDVNKWQYLAINGGVSIARSHGTFNKVSSVSSFVFKLFYVLSPKVAWEQIKGQLSTWDIVRFGVELVALIVAVTASNGAAFYVKLILSIDSVLKTINSAKGVYESC